MSQKKSIIYYPSTQNKLATNTDYFEKYKGKSFKEFWDLLPNNLPLYQYEKELEQLTKEKKYIRIKKATGLGISEFYIRWIAWKCFETEENSPDVFAVIITGARLELAIQLIDRLKGLFDHDFDNKNTVCVLNGKKIEAFPSHHLASARGLNPKIVLLDEADFFPIGQQEEARSVSERYIPKSNPYLIMVSTPYNPGGLYDRMDKEKNSLWYSIEWNYEVGLKAGIYTPEMIEKAKQSKSFEREYNLKFGVGHGSIYPYELINELTQSYDLGFSNGQMVRTIDPAFGSSKFAIMETEMIDGIAYPKYCVQIDRPSPTAMTELIVSRNAQFPMPTLVDSAHPGLIRDLVDRNVSASEVRFNSELSNMTIEGSQMVKEKRVRFHPDICQDLTAQLKAVETNDKGHPDKKKLNFDLGDCYQMMANYFKNSRASIIKMSQYDEEEDM